MKEVISGAAAIVIAALILAAIGINDDGSPNDRSETKTQHQDNVIPTPIDLTKPVSPTMYSLSNDRKKLILAPLANDERWAVVHDGTHANGKYVDSGTYAPDSTLNNVYVYITKNEKTITALTKVKP